MKSKISVLIDALESRIAKREVVSGISDILYHATSIYAATKILEQNRFALTFVSGADDTNRPKSKYYYLSTTRSRSGSYHEGTRLGVLFVLDGRKLSHNYTGDPVDYWGPDFRKVAPSKNEMEDRIWSKKPFIEPASKYIKEMHVTYDLKEPFDDKTVKDPMLKSLLLAGQNHGFPIYVYRDEKAGRLLDKRRAVPLSELNLSDVPAHEYPSSPLRDSMDAWLELYEKRNKDDLSTEPYGGAKRLLDTLFSFNGFSSFKADVHNSKKGTPSLHKIVEVLRKKKWDIKDFYDHLKDKWQ